MADRKPFVKITEEDIEIAREFFEDEELLKDWLYNVMQYYMGNKPVHNHKLEQKYFTAYKKTMDFIINAKEAGSKGGKKRAENQSTNDEPLKGTSTTLDSTVEPPLEATLQPNNKLVTNNNQSLTSNYEEESKEENILLCSISDESELDKLEDQISFAFWKLFKKHKTEMGINSTVNLDKAKLQDWSNHVDKTMRLDKRTHEEFKEVWRFLNTNEWWKGKVQSMEKLRKQFETLLQNSRTKPPTKGNKPQISQEGMERLAQKLGG